MNSVDALQEVEQVKAVTAFLGKHYSETIKDCWVVGLQLTLRISDLLSIRYDQIAKRKGLPVLELNETKTGKFKRITLNDTAIRVIDRRKKDYTNDVFIFQSHHNRVKVAQPLGRAAIHKAIKEAGDSIGLRLGTHTMRKTRGYMVYKQTNDIALVMHLLNQSNVASTLRYLGITEDKVQETYNLEIH